MYKNAHSHQKFEVDSLTLSLMITAYAALPPELLIVNAIAFRL